jgi:hypothetical protein
VVSQQGEHLMVSDCKYCFAVNECLNSKNRVAVNDHERLSKLPYATSHTERQFTVYQ